MVIRIKPETGKALKEVRRAFLQSVRSGTPLGGLREQAP